MIANGTLALSRAAGLGLVAVALACAVAVATGVPWFAAALGGAAVVVAGIGARTRQAAPLAAEGIALSLRLEVEQLRQSLALARVGTWRWDIRTGRIHYDVGCSAMLGYREGEIANALSAWGKLVHRDDLARAREAVDSIVDGRAEHYEVQVRLRGADGRWRTIVDRGRVRERDDAGRPTLAVGVHLDMTPEPAVPIAATDPELEARPEVTAGTSSAELVSLIGVTLPPA